MHTKYEVKRRVSKFIIRTSSSIREKKEMDFPVKIQLKR